MLIKLSNDHYEAQLCHKIWIKCINICLNARFKIFIKSFRAQNLEKDRDGAEQSETSEQACLQQKKKSMVWGGDGA